MVWSRVVKFGRCKRPLGCAFCCSCENLPKFGLGISLWKTRPYVKIYIRTSVIWWNSPIIPSSLSLVVPSLSMPLPGSGVSIQTPPGPSMDTGIESRGTVSSELPVLTLLTTTEQEEAQSDRVKGQGHKADGGPESPHPAKGSASGQSPKPISTQRGRSCHCVCSQTKAVYEPHVLISSMQVRKQNNPSYVVLSGTWL